MKKCLALVLILICVLGLAGCDSNSRKEKVLMRKGPWANEAVWVDDNSQMYLICTQDKDDSFATVQAFLLIEEQWYSSQLHLNQGAPIVSFVTSDGEKFLEARAKINDQKLQLYDFEVYAENLTLPYTDVELSKFPFQEQVDKLPFEIKQSICAC